jgi:alpha-tubulin suppressor-like RCC1 family protein
LQPVANLVRAAAAALVGALGLVGLASAAGASTPQLYSWGDFGEDGPVSPIVTSPKPITGIPGTVAQLATSNAATYVLTTAGTVWAFGANHRGELGNGTTTNSFATPVQVKFPAGVTIASLPTPMPYSTGLAIDTSGTVWGWGLDEGGELCLGNTSDQLVPVRLPFTNAVLATGAGDHAIYDASGHVESCGDDSVGELGDGTQNSSTTPVEVTGLPALPVRALYSGYQSTAALMSDGELWTWGLDTLGQLGDNATTNSDVPVSVSAFLSAPVSQAFMGGNTAKDGQSLAILNTGKIVGWGSDGWGQLCTGTVAKAVPHPLKVVPPAGVTWTHFTSGGSTSYMLDSSANLWACGANANGEIGNGTTSTDQVTPVKVLAKVAQFSSTSRNVAALTS